MTHVRAGASNKLKAIDCTNGECPPPVTTGECKDKAGIQWVHYAMYFVQAMAAANGCFLVYSYSWKFLENYWYSKENLNEYLEPYLLNLIILRIELKIVWDPKKNHVVFLTTS